MLILFASQNSLPGRGAFRKPHPTSPLGATWRLNGSTPTAEFARSLVRSGPAPTGPRSSHFRVPAFAMASATPKASPNSAAVSCHGVANPLSRPSPIVQTAMRSTGEVVRPVIVGFDALSLNSIKCRSRVTVDYDLFGLPSSFNRLNRLRFLRRFSALSGRAIGPGPSETARPSRVDSVTGS